MRVLAVIGGETVEHQLPAPLPATLAPYARDIAQGIAWLGTGRGHVSHPLGGDDVLTITTETEQ